MNTLYTVINGILEHLRARTSWRTWVVVGYIVIVLVFIACSIAFVYAPINDVVLERQFSNLTTTAQADANALACSDDAETFVSDAVQGTDLRMTIIDSEGNVLADSEIDPSTLANHLSRPEVASALQGTVGTAQRTSASDGIKQLYVAVPATYQNELVALRISEPSSSLTIITNSVRATIAIVIVIGILTVIIAAFFSWRKATKPFKQLDQVRSDFVANASHELKTPVAGIKLLSEAIRDAADIGDTKNLSLFLDRLENETERLQRLVIDLLDLSRLEDTSSSSDRPPRVDLHSSLTTSLFAHRGEAEDKDLQLIFEDKSSPGDDCYIAMEPADASLVFDNLIENAIMYTDEGQIVVTYESRAHEIAVIVEDTGIGIPQADQTRIFERFYRVDKTRSREVGGTGLGLALVKHAVDRAHGSIHVASTVGQGTQFSVIFPRANTRDTYNQAKK